MSNFCTQCGSPLKPDMTFCTKCGAAVKKEEPKKTASDLVDEIVVKKIPQKPKTSPKKKKANNSAYGAIIVVAVCLAVIVGCGGGYYLYSERQKSTVVSDNQLIPQKASTLTTSQSKSETDKINVQNTITQKKIDDTIKKAGAELSRYGYSDDFSYTTYGHSDAGFLTLYQGGEMVLVDRKNRRAGIVRVREGFENFRIAIDKKQTGSVIINCEFENEKPGRDQDAGYWKGTTHCMSVFANYSFERNGELKPGMLTTGRGENPRHLQEVLYETRNVDFINLFLTESLYVDLM